jgi:hypothetical protein
MFDTLAESIPDRLLEDQKMITPITGAHPIDAGQVAQAPAEPKPHPQAQTPPVQRSGLWHDQVTLTRL